MKPEKEKLTRLHWYVILAGCGLIGTCLGLGVNASGLFFTAVAEDLQCGRGSAAATLTVYSLMHALIGMIAPKALDRFGLKKMVFFGTVLQAGSIFLQSLCPNIFGLWGLNALRGTAAGLIGTVSVTILINRWFHKDNALMTSIVIGFSGIAGALVSPLFSAIIQNHGWRTGYQVMAAIALLFHLPALLLPISLRPEEKGAAAYGETEVSEEADEEAGPISKRIYYLALLYGVSASCVSAFPSHFAGLAESYGLVSAGALMVSACMAANTGGKVLLGKWIDAAGVQRPVTVFCLLVCLSCLALFFLRIPSVLVFSSGVFGFVFALTTVAQAVMIRDLFGRSRYSELYPPAALAATIAYAVFTGLYGFFYDKSGTYAYSLLTAFVLMAVSLLFCTLAYRGKKKTSQ